MYQSESKTIAARIPAVGEMDQKDPIEKHNQNKFIINPNTTSWSADYTDKLNDLQGIFHYGP